MLAHLEQLQMHKREAIAAFNATVAAFNAGNCGVAPESDCPCGHQCDFRGMGKVLFPL
jgi:hypothetical protein